MNRLPAREAFEVEGALYFLKSGEYLFRAFKGASSAAKFVSPHDVVAAFSTYESDSGWLPEGILRTGWCKSGPFFISASPPQIRTLFVVMSTAKDDLRILHVPMPGYVLLGVGKAYSIFACRPEKLNDRSPLYAMPTPNVYSHGGICFGNNTPRRAFAKDSGYIHDLFWESPFNEHLSSDRVQGYSDARKFLLELDGQKEFPYDRLLSFRPELTVETLYDRFIRA